MLLDYTLQALASYWPTILFIAIIVWLFKNKYGKGLNRYPGPVLAAYTNWWRFYDVRAGHPQDTHIKLHREHGDVVRLGPNVLSFSDPEAIKDIYGLNKGFVKTEFYAVQQNVSKGNRLQSLFSTLDETYHAQLRRCVNSAFSMSSLISCEPLVDSTIKTFLSQTATRFCKAGPDGKTCDFARWLQFFAFDVVGEITFSKRLGFIETGEDVDGIVAAIADILAYSGQVGQQPWLDRYLLRKNPVKLWLMKHGLIGSSNAVAAFAQARSDERASVKSGDEVEETENGKSVDLLSRFRAAQKQHPEFMTDLRVLIATVSLINAGSDTTAISLASVFYHLLRHPHVYTRLMTELDGAAADPAKCPSMSGSAVNSKDSPGQESIISFADAQKLPYLDAVIQESFRVFPAAGLILERRVPPGGATICGNHIPGGTIVGCNAWVLHRNTRVFGDDVDSFRPERWLLAPGQTSEDDKDAILQQEGGTATRAQLKEMRATMFQFGAGARTCIGKNISLLEIYKLVPMFLRRFEISSAMDGDWKTRNCWFVRQLDFCVKFKERRA